MFPLPTLSAFSFYLFTEAAIAPWRHSIMVCPRYTKSSQQTRPARCLYPVQMSSRLWRLCPTQTVSLVVVSLSEQSAFLRVVTSGTTSVSKLFYRCFDAAVDPPHTHTLLEGATAPSKLESVDAAFNSRKTIYAVDACTDFLMANFSIGKRRSTVGTSVRSPSVSHRAHAQSVRPSADDPQLTSTVVFKNVQAFAVFLLLEKSKSASIT